LEAEELDRTAALALEDNTRCMARRGLGNDAEGRVQVQASHKTRLICVERSQTAQGERWKRVEEMFMSAAGARK
jgi:hypothetical protein